MTEPTPLYSGEAVLRGRGESDKSGQWIRLELSDAGGVHPFKGYEGERFMVVCVPIGNDDKPMTKQVTRSVTHTPGKAGDGSHREDGRSLSGESAQSPATKPKRHWRDMPPSQRAALLMREYEFQEFYYKKLKEPGDGMAPFDDLEYAMPGLVNDWVKRDLGIASRRALDPGPDHNAAALAKFEAIEGDYQAYRQAKGHGQI